MLDTNIVTAALRSASGASNAMLMLVATRQLVPLVTSALFYEYEDVLKRPEQQLAHGLEISGIDRFLDAFASAAEPVELRFRWRPQLGDPGDEMVLEAAVNGQADALVTHNIRDFAEAAAKFGLRVLSPAQAIKEYGQ